MPFVSKQATVDGRTTEYLTAGDGEPLIFLHGGGIVEGFDPLLALADRYQVIVPFMPGYSGTAIDPPVDSRDGLVAHVGKFLDAIGIDKTLLVGHSMGGWLAASTAATLPDRVSKLVIVAPYGMDGPDHPIAEVFGMTPDQERAALTNDPSVWEGRVPDGSDPDFDAARELEGQSVSRFMPGLFDPELEALVGSIDHPTLILWGDDDKIIPVSHAPNWQAAIPQAELTVYPGAGHLLFHERSEAAEAIAAFATA